MAEIVNLRQARKQKARADRERTAEQNRIRHGRTKAEREAGHRNAGKAEKFIDGHRRERRSEPDADGE